MRGREKKEWGGGTIALHVENLYIIFAFLSKPIISLGQFFDRNCHRDYYYFNCVLHEKSATL